VIQTLVVLLEEPSAKALLEGLLPRLIPVGVDVVYLVFEGKQDLEKNVTRKIAGWQRPDSAFLILRDRDAGKCDVVKKRLRERVVASGRTALIRIACRDLEAWVAGDLEALAKAFDTPELAKSANKAKFRDPDALVRPVEEVQRVVPEYKKVEGARRVGPWLEPSRSTSHSFRVFCSGVRGIFQLPS